MSVCKYIQVGPPITEEANLFLFVRYYVPEPRRQLAVGRMIAFHWTDKAKWCGQENYPSQRVVI